jgi:hypothetical protein
MTKKEEQEELYDIALVSAIAEALGKKIEDITMEDRTYFFKYYSK